MNFRTLFSPVLLLTAFLAGFTGATLSAKVEVVYVANAENYSTPLVRYTGREWRVSQSGYLEGKGKGHLLLGQMSPGEGDFTATFNLSFASASRESSIVVDGVSELVMRGTSGLWELRGRFFRAGEKPIRVNAPKFEPEVEFTVFLDRRGGRIRITVNGVEIYEGVCGSGPLSGLGLDPGSGTLRLNTFTATGNFPAGGGKLFDNSFGMQLQPKPASARQVTAPTIARVAPSNECSLVTLRDGTIQVYFVTKPTSDSISVISSTDGGLTWGDPEIAFKIPGTAYYAVKVVEDRNGGLQAVYHLFGQGPGGYNGRLYEVYHTRKEAGSNEWTKEKRIIPGYVGSIRGMAALKSGRLVVGVGKAMPGRDKAPASGPDLGWNDTLVYYSDDLGDTWQQSPDVLQVELKKKFPTRYGAVEPAIVELKDGRVWMLVRDRDGWFWESTSADGSRWSPLKQTRFITSDSPAELLRLRDGRMVMLLNSCQNWGNPLSYAAGGREVLLAAISADDGKTWKGFREILHETNLVGGGDRGSAYPSATESRDGKIAVVSGQGLGKHAILLFDPNWLTADSVTDDLTAGPVGWTQYGDQHLHTKTLEDRSQALAIPLKSTGLCGASWNFPMTDTGVLSFRLWVPVGVSSLRLSLNDHFTRIDDSKAAENAVYTLSLPVDAKPGWRNVTLTWKSAEQGAALEVDGDGTNAGSIKAQRGAVFGVNYLRFEFTGNTDTGELMIAGVKVKKSSD